MVLHVINYNVHAPVKTVKPVYLFVADVYACMFPSCMYLIIIASDKNERCCSSVKSLCNTYKVKDISD